MKTSEFYERALCDAAFRREKLAELRYAKTVGAVMFCLCVGVGVAESLYTGLREGRWDAGGGVMFVAAFVAIAYSSCANRLAALAAFEAEASRTLPSPAASPASD